MMKAASLGVVLSLVVALLAVGIPYWSIPYAQAQLPNALPTPSLLILGLAAAVLCFVFGVGVLRAGAVMGTAIPAVILARVLVETSADPTSHNLWPLEVVLAAGIGFPVAFCGALVGRLCASVVRGR